MEKESLDMKIGGGGGDAGEVACRVERKARTGARGSRRAKQQRRAKVESTLAKGLLDGSAALSRSCASGHACALSTRNQRATHLVREEVIQRHHPWVRAEHLRCDLTDAKNHRSSSKK
eukprot:156068-Pleurochrysis_carterae.AAC.1